jgi:membrane-bound lytic murein transglycosylase B
MIKNILTTFFLTLSFFIPTVTLAQPSWNTWIQQLRTEALAQGIQPQLFDQVFAGLTPMQQTLNLEKSQPESRITFAQYRKTRGDAYRIQLGRRQTHQYQALLNNLEQQYGVSPCIIMSLWGMESSYGRYLGNFPVIRTLATLAYNSRRHEFFRNELLIALHILNEGHIDNSHFKGEWAGASGQPQFLPSSWKKFAVDYDGDGHKNIWTSIPDALASIANYLKLNGWQARQPWGVEVSLPSGFDSAQSLGDVKKTVHDWLATGVKIMPNHQSVSPNLMATILTPKGGPSLMIFDNFNVIKQYNNSNFYAGTISYMADTMCAS